MYNMNKLIIQKCYTNIYLNYSQKIKPIFYTCGYFGIILDINCKGIGGRQFLRSSK